MVVRTINTELSGRGRKCYILYISNKSLKSKLVPKVIKYYDLLPRLLGKLAPGLILLKRELKTKLLSSREQSISCIA